MYPRTVLVCCALFLSVLGARYDPTWNSIDSRPLPAWYDEAKLGIFIHWGVFSVPSINSEWFWYRWLANRTPEIVNYMNNNYKPDFTYADFAPQFTAEFFDPNQWADMFNASGADWLKMSPRTVLIFCAFFVSVLGVRYDPTWNSIDSRPLPAWYDEAKLGIFIHWGVFSVPSINSEWFWERWQTSRTPEVVNFMKNNYKPDFTYADFAPQFTAEFFDANQWADMFSASGAEYIVFVSKHHEGYTNWPSNHSFNWNSMAVGPKRDIVGELAAAIKTNTSIHFGLYHSLFEWFHPLYLQDKENNFSTQNFVIDKTMPELYELINTYKPDVIWSDGDWEASSDYWQSKEFLAWLYTDSPVKDTVVTNDRWGKDSTCHHGGFFTCQDRYQPGKLQPRKWENAMTIDRKSWGYRRNAQLSEYLSTQELLSTFIETVSFGGNMLMNVGPTKEGTIHPIFEERLRDVGSWLNVNGEAIRSSRPWTSQNDTLTPHVWYTMKNSDVYAILLDWPTGSTLSLGAPMTQTGTTVQLLGYSGNFMWKARSGRGIDITIPPISANKIPCKWAWTFKLSGLATIY